MSSKIVQVKSNVNDPDFPSVSLEHLYMEYVKSFDSNIVLFKFVNAPKDYVEMCKRAGLDHKMICLNRSEVLWHKKDWNIPKKTPNLSCYSTVKRNRG